MTNSKSTIDIFNDVKDIISNCNEDDFLEKYKAVHELEELFGISHNERRYVYAVRIYNVDGYKLMADLALGDGGRPNGEVVTILWDSITMREKYLINGYTFIFDERDIVKKLSFKDYIKQKYKFL